MPMNSAAFDCNREIKLLKLKANYNKKEYQDLQSLL